MSVPTSPRRGGAQSIPRPISSHAGQPAPWSGLPESALRPSVADVRAAMVAAGRPLRSPLEHSGVRASAVLAALYDHDGLAHVVLTRRAQHLRSHRGEVSFPGGGQESGEDLERTALRESEEETGLDPATVEVIGELDHRQTITSRSFIVPYVGILAGRPELTPSPFEVELILHVSLTELLQAEVFREERWGLPPLDRPIYFFEIAGDTIWGATASMLRNLLALVTGTPWRSGDW